MTLPAHGETVTRATPTLSPGLPVRAGLGLKSPHFRDVLETQPDIGFFEVHAENFFVEGGPFHHALTRIRARYALSVHGVGLSIGGMTVQGIMLKHADRLKSVVIANWMGKVAEEFVSAWQDRINLSHEKGMDPLIQPTMERWFTEGFRNQGTPEAQAIADMIASTSVNGYAGCAAAIQNLNYLDSLGQISGIPVLFIAGAQDAGTPPAGMEAMHANMPGSEYVLLDPAAHISNVERPDAFNAALTGFLAKH